MKFWWIFVVFLLLGCPASYEKRVKKAGAEKDKTRGEKKKVERPILKVGKYAFSKGDIEFRQKQILWKYPSYDRKKISLVAYSQLIQGYLLVEFLEKLGHGITKQILQKELARIDKNTKRPLELKKLKAIYKDSPEKYATLGILPDFANGYYYFQIFPKLKKVQLVIKARAKKALYEILSQKKVDLLSFAKANPKWQRAEFLFHPDRGFFRLLPNRKKGDPRWKEEEKRWQKEKAQGDRLKLYQRMERGIFSKLKKGELFSQVVEFDRTFSILRPLGWKDHGKGIRMVEMASLPKIGGGSYFRERAGDIPLWVKDEVLRKQLRSRFPWIGQGN